MNKLDDLLNMTNEEVIEWFRTDILEKESGTECMIVYDRDPPCSSMGYQPRFKVVKARKKKTKESNNDT